MDITQSVTKTQDLPSEQTAGQIVAEGHERAKQLMDLVTQNQWAKNIQGKNYLQVEAWQTLGRFYGYTAITRETQYVEYDGVKGFDARVEVIDKDGKVVGGAEASCMMDEQNWRGKPLFSVKSMAQTRALGKAYRQILSFVAVMGGYEPTPAEEMDGVVIAPRQQPLPVSNGSVVRKPSYGQIVALEKFIQLNPNEWREIMANNGIKSKDEVVNEKIRPVMDQVFSFWKKPSDQQYPSKYDQQEKEFNEDLMNRESL